MFTIKHHMEFRDYACEVASFTAKRDDGRLIFQTFNDTEGCQPAGTWDGFLNQDDCPGDVVYCVIFVMNSHGSTVAKYSYFAEKTRFVENGKLPVLPEDQNGDLIDPEKLAA